MLILLKKVRCSRGEWSTIPHFISHSFFWPIITGNHMHHLNLHQHQRKEATNICFLVSEINGINDGHGHL